MDLDLEILDAIYTNKNNSLYSITKENCVLLIFLRHFGCTFCRETLDDIYKVKKELIAKSIIPIFVHMAEDEIADSYLKKYQLPMVQHISDPDMSLYEYFGLNIGSFTQLYGLKMWIRGMQLMTNYGVTINQPLGNMQQMPGIFLIKNNKITNSFIHNSVADRPDYLSIANCDCSKEK